MAKGQAYQVPVGTAHFHTKDIAPIINAMDAHDTAGYVTLLNGIANGSGDDQRTGKLILARSLGVRWHVYADTATAVHPATLVVSIIKDTQPSTVTPNFTDVFSDTNPLAYFNLNNTARFSSIYRKVCYIGTANQDTTGAAPMVSGGNSLGHDDVFKNLNEQIRFDGDNDGVTDIFDCAYYLVVQCKYHDGTITTYDSDAERIKFEFTSRFRYHDL